MPRHITLEDIRAAIKSLEANTSMPRDLMPLPIPRERDLIKEMFSGQFRSKGGKVFKGKRAKFMGLPVITTNVMGRKK